MNGLGSLVFYTAVSLGMAKSCIPGGDPDPTPAACTTHADCPAAQYCKADRTACVAEVTDLAALFVRGVQANLNVLVNPAWGVLRVQRPGAIDVVSRHASMAELRDGFFHDRDFLAIRGQARIEALPQFSCDTEGWNKSGIFFEAASNYHQQSDLMLAINDAFGADLLYTAQQISAIRAIEARVTHRAISTSQSLELLFGRDATGAYYLLGVIAYGCDA